MPSLILVAPPALNVLICSAILFLSFVNGSAQLGFGGKRKQRHLVFALEGRQSRGRGVAQWAQERANRIAQVEHERHVEGKFVAAEDGQFLDRAVFANLEVVFFQIAP